MPVSICALIRIYATDTYRPAPAGCIPDSVRTCRWTCGWACRWPKTEHILNLCSFHLKKGSIFVHRGAHSRENRNTPWLSSLTLIPFTVKITILSRYRYRPITEFKSSWLNVTLLPSPSKSEMRRFYKDRFLRRFWI